MDHQPLTRTQSFHFQCLKETKAVQFQHKHSNLLPHCQLPPSQRVSGSAVTSFPAKTLNYHISRTRHIRIPCVALNWDLVSSILYTKNHVNSSTGILCIWPVFVPLWSDRGRAGKKKLQLPSSFVPPCDNSIQWPILLTWFNSYPITDK